MKNVLKLHEAIAVVLLSRPKRTASCEEIADEINRRNLYFRKNRTPVPAYQIMMRSKLNKGRYNHILKFIGKNKVRLVNV